MSIYKQKNSDMWWVAVYVPGSLRKAGKRQYIRKSTGTADKATALAIEQVIKMSLNRTSAADKLHGLIDVLLGEDKKEVFPVAGIWSEYTRIYKMSDSYLSDRTLKGREGVMLRFNAWIAEYRTDVTDVSNINKRVAAAFADYLKNEMLQAKTRKNIIGDLSAVWRQLMTIHPLDNPWAGLSPTTTNSQRGRAFTREEETAILAAADAAGYGWGLMCRIARHTGLRYGDIVRLKGIDIDFDLQAIRIKPSKTERHGVDVIAPLPDDVMKMIPAGQAGYLFPDAAKCYPQIFRVYRFRKILEDAGLDSAIYTFHSWRHTFRTRLSEAGVSDDIARRMGGWTQQETALRYDHATRLEERRKAMEAAITHK